MENKAEDYPTTSPLERLTSYYFPASSSSSSSSTTPTTSTYPTDPSLFVRLEQYLLASPTSVAIVSSVGTTGLVLGSLVFYRRYWRRIPNAEAVPGRTIQNKRFIRGIVTSVGDGDGFRIYHTPGPFYSYPFRFRNVPETSKELKDQTISIRIAGIDAPETAHFGRPAQAHSQESLDWLRERLLQPARKRVKVQVLRRDQYGRIVGIPYVRRLLLPDQPLPIEMLKRGMAVVYESAGAEYGPWGLTKLKELEATAKSAKVGIWSLPASKFEHPADYKKRHKIGDDPVSPASKTAEAAAVVGKGVWGWVKGWWRR
ncbi:hypothetical protein HD553DRAFT_277018 [Filobasidium floriforme]|uniref:uncharacterized protein n=1 Tax=Filobasidium floriforme TaxID=5210 RepID=UPI001E8EC2F7|nr:uncharacterized protein HD553DRAFT_277018 [Filobasidium floriforme]KAH8079679.1 hypothetical protein HD553DRAFT_277018 [Filobasidium floriforme]